MPEQRNSQFEEVVRSLRVYNALRVCLATSICVLVSAWFQLPLCFESVIGVLVLFSIYNSQILQKGIERVLGRIIGGVLGLLLATFLFDVRPLFVLFLSVFLFWGMYRFAHGDTPYASGNAGFSLAAVMIVSCVSPETASQFTFNWLLQVTIGVVVALAVDRILPYRVTEALNAGINEVFHTCSRKLDELVRESVNDPQTGKKAELNPEFFSQVVGFVEFRNRLRYEGPFSADLYLRLLGHAKTLFCKIERAEKVLRCLPMGWLNRDYLSSIVRTFKTLSADCNRTGEGFSNGLPFRNEKDVDLTDYACLQEVYGDWRSKPPKDEEEREIRKRFGVLVGLVRDIQRELSYVRTLDTGRIAGDSEGDLNRRIQSAQTNEKAIDWGSVRKATVITATILIVFACLIYLQIPGGEDALVSGLVVGAQANLGYSFLKWKLRTGGAFFGALYGLLAMLIISHVPHFPVMMFLLLCGIFVASYIANGPEDIAYGGLQAGIALAIVLVYDPGPPRSMDAVEARFWGAVIGGCVALIVHYVSWGTHPLHRLQAQLSHMIGEIGIIFAESVSMDNADRSSRVRLSQLVAVDMENSLKLFKAASHMVDGSNRDLELFERLILRLMDVISLVSTLRRECANLADHSMLRNFIADTQTILDELSSAFDGLKDKLGEPGSSQFHVNIREIETEFGTTVERFRKQGKTLAAGAADVASIAVVHEALSNLLRSLAEISDIATALDMFEMDSLKRVTTTS